MFEHLQDSFDTIIFKNSGNVNSLGGFVGVIVNILIGVTIAIATVGIGYSFFLYVISRGDKDAVKKAKTSLTWSVIAFVIALFVVALKGILYKMLGVTNFYEKTETPF